MEKNKIYIILPCYNEEKNIALLIQDWLKELKSLKNKIDYEIVVVDDGSQDKTKVIASKMSEENNVSVISHSKNKGLGEVLNTGINYVLHQNDGSYICIMDADQTHRPKYIHSMLNKMNEKNYGCVIASRYEKGAKVEGLSKDRIILSYCARVLYQLVFRVKGVKDYTCGYRLYNVECVERLKQKYGEQIIEESSFACMAELLYKLAKEECTFAEIPFTLKYQLKEGTSKMQIIKTIKRSVRTLVKLRFS